ncbi:MAG: undecaprenyl-diphosphatase UppP [bacterium]
MSIFQSIFLGIIQGISEFLPISSSAHLIIAREFLHWQDPGIAFDVMLHWGTLIGVVWFFRSKWMQIFKSFFRRGKYKREEDEARRKQNQKLFWMIAAATIPAGLAGYFFNEYVESVLRSPAVIAGVMILFGILLFIADKVSDFKNAFPFKKGGLGGFLLWPQSIFIGFSQALALIPGVSRSGATMTAGLFSGLDRKSAAEFSFLLSAPIIFGAGLKELPDFIQSGGLNLSGFLGFITAAISGFIAIKFLIKYLEKGSFRPFVWYRILLGIAILLLLL